MSDYEMIKEMLLQAFSKRKMSREEFEEIYSDIDGYLMIFDEEEA